MADRDLESRVRAALHRETSALVDLERALAECRARVDCLTSLLAADRPQVEHRVVPLAMTSNSGVPTSVTHGYPDASPAPAPTPKPTKSRKPRALTPSPKSNTAGVSDAQMKVLRHLEEHGAMTAAKLAAGLYGNSKRAGVLTGKVLRPLAKDGLAVEDDGFWRVTEQGACVALDA